MTAVIALTGGIGAGKSSVARLLREHGATIIDADAVARECADDNDTRTALRAIVPLAFDAAGALNRKAMAAQVFGDAGVRQAVEQVMHPWIRDRMRQLASSFIDDGAQVVVMEIPLLAETRTKSEATAEFDAVLSVEAQPDVRLQRLMTRGLAAEDARARMAAQASDDARRSLATWVIHNDGNETELAQQVAAVWKALNERFVGGIS